MAGRLNVSGQSPYEPLIGFSRAVRVGNDVFVSGTAPIAEGGGTAAPGDPYGQARRCWEIVGSALSQAGAGFEDVVRTRTYLKNSADWEDAGRAHGEVFRDVRPASTMVVADLLQDDWLVEVEADAVVGLRD